MGKKPDQIEQDIKTQRHHIANRIEGLERRIQEDVQTVQSEARERAATAVDEAKGKLDEARGTLRLDQLKSMVEEHTVSTMAGALGVGVLLGVVSEGLGGGSNGHENRDRSRDGRDGRYGHDSRRDEGGRGLPGIAGMSGIVASMLGPAANTAQEELQSLVREGFSLVKEQIQQVKDSRNDNDVEVKNRDVGVE